MVHNPRLAVGGVSTDPVDDILHRRYPGALGGAILARPAIDLAGDIAIGAPEIGKSDRIGIDAVERSQGRDHRAVNGALFGRSEEHTSELQSLMRISYAVFCLTKKKTDKMRHTTTP